MSWMFTRFAGVEFEGVEAFVNVRPTMLEDNSWFVPFIETMTREKLPWAETPARHRYHGFPPPEDYAMLMEEFSRTD
jgi:hypothetical protein